jgi:hypothetical protein
MRDQLSSQPIDLGPMLMQQFLRLWPQLRCAACRRLWSAGGGLGLSKDRELRSQWQRAAELLLAEADVGALSKAVELALFYDAKLDVAAS